MENQKKTSNVWIIVSVILLIALIGSTAYLTYGLIKLNDTEKKMNQVIEDKQNCETTKHEENNNSGVTSEEKTKYYSGSYNNNKYYLIIGEHERVSNSQKSQGRKYTYQYFVLNEETPISNDSISGTYYVENGKIILRSSGEFNFAFPGFFDIIGKNSSSGVNQVSLDYSEDKIMLGEVELTKE